MKPEPEPETGLMRIIAGDWKGRRSRPRTGRGCGRRRTGCARRSSTCWPRGCGARFLDGYAGTGAVGIEALSRGAAHVTFVEHDRRGWRSRANLRRCGVADRHVIIRVGFAGRGQGCVPRPFDLIFLDPPYGGGALLERSTRPPR